MLSYSSALLFVFFGLAGGGSAYAQSVFMSGGAHFHESPGTEATSTRPAAQLGVRFWYSDLFRLQGAVTYQDLVAGEVALQVHPLRRFEADPFGAAAPYAFIGVGRYLANHTIEKSTVPLGIGVEYPLGPQVKLSIEAAARWTVQESSGANRLDLASGFMPTVGVSYDLSRAFRPEPEEAPPLAGRSDALGNGPASEAEETSSEEADDGDQDNGGMAAEYAPTSYAASGGEAETYPETDTVDVDADSVMVRIPAGTFIMGLTDEDPLSLQSAGRKRVTVSTFYLDRYEVTNEDYRAFLDEQSPQRRQALIPDSTVWEEVGVRSTWQEYFRGAVYDDYPVVGVTYEQAQAYCQAQGKRLPTEAEWEYAARASRVGGIYPWPGFEPRNARGRYLANYNPARGGYAADGYAFTAPVDAYPPNPWKLYNMSGNVAEWVMDAYAPSYTALSDFNPLHEDPEEPRRVVRGGSWASDAFYIGVGVRDRQEADEATPYVGFRCAMDVANRAAGQEE